MTEYPYKGIYRFCMFALCTKEWQWIYFAWLDKVICVSGKLTVYGEVFEDVLLKTLDVYTIRSALYKVEKAGNWSIALPV